MPIYEYECADCGNVFEKLVFSASAAIECPGCDGKKVKKLLSAFRMGGGSKNDGAGSGSSSSSCSGCSGTSCSTCH